MDPVGRERGREKMGLGVVSGGINRKRNDAGTACLELDLRM